MLLWDAQLIGPGEAKEADIGIAGGIKEGLLFKKGKIIRKIKQENMAEELKQEIRNMLKMSPLVPGLNGDIDKK